MNLDTKSCPFVKEGKKSTRLGDVFPRHACLNEWPAEVGVGLGGSGGWNGSSRGNAIRGVGDVGAAHLQPPRWARRVKRQSDLGTEWPDVGSIPHSTNIVFCRTGVVRC